MKLTAAQREVLRKRTSWWLRFPKRNWTPDEKALIDSGLIETGVVAGIPSWRLSQAGRAALAQSQGEK